MQSFLHNNWIESYSIQFCSTPHSHLCSDRSGSNLLCFAMFRTPLQQMRSFNSTRGNRLWIQRLVVPIKRRIPQLSFTVDRAQRASAQQRRRPGQQYFLARPHFLTLNLKFSRAAGSDSFQGHDWRAIGNVLHLDSVLSAACTADRES